MSNVALSFQFSPRRAWLLARNQLAFQWKGIVLALSVLGGSFFIIYLLSIFGGRGNGFPQGFFYSCLTFIGFLLPGHAFRDIHRPSRCQAWFMLPASLAEKYLVTALLSTIGAILLLLAGYSVLDQLLRGLSWLILGRNHQAFNPVDRRLWTYIAVILALQPLFLFGSIRFAKAAFLKTLLCVIGGSILLGALAVGFVALITWGRGLDIPPESVNLPFISGFFRILFFAAFPLFFLIAGWFRLMESEARVGVP